MEAFSAQISIDIAGLLALAFMLFTLTGEQSLNNPKNRRLADVFFGIFLIALSDLMACLYSGRTNWVVQHYIAKTANYVLSYITFYPFHRYLSQTMGLSESESLFFRKLCGALAAAMAIFSLLNPLHKLLFSIDPQTGIYQRELLYPMHSFVFCLLAAGSMAIVFMKKGISSHNRLMLILICGFSFVTELIQTLQPQFLFTNLSVMVAVVIIYAFHFYEQNRDAQRNELELENARSALVLSQIQPHFLFNSMTAIMDLCDTNPEEAKDALQELSGYLHYKISAMSHSYMVPFTEDLDFMNNYLKLEKRRFGSRLRVEYDIACSDFQVPLLTLQPLVENAIRHGISKRPAGGTVKIITREQAERYIIRIEDDGVGFAAREEEPERPNHVGLPNVRRRVAALCGGTLYIESQPGVGTVVEIILRKEKGESAV